MLRHDLIESVGKALAIGLLTLATLYLAGIMH